MRENASGILSRMPSPRPALPAPCSGPMHILGINAYHGDSSACLVRGGTLIAAAEEERFRRIKHWAGLPAEAIAYCLSEAGINLGDVDHVVGDPQERPRR